MFGQSPYRLRVGFDDGVDLGGVRGQLRVHGNDTGLGGVREYPFFGARATLRVHGAVAQAWEKGISVFWSRVNPAFTAVAQAWED